MRAADLDAQGFRLEPVALARFTRHVGEIAGDLLARPVAVGLAEAALEVGDHALERPLGLVGAHAVVVGEADLGFAGAVEDRVLRLLRQILPLGFEGEAVVLAQGEQRLHVIGRARFRPRRNGAAAQGALLVGNDQLGIDVLLDAEPAAFRAGAERVVEREQPRLDLRDGEAGHRAGEFFREGEAVRVRGGGRREFGFLLPLPLVGRGWGWGSCGCVAAVPHLPTPHPDPPPQGGREKLRPQTPPPRGRRRA